VAITVHMCLLCEGSRVA